MVNAALMPLACVSLALHVSADVKAPTCEARDVPVACGRLAQDRSPDNLFHVGELWLHAPRGSVMDRWLSQAANGQVAVTLTSHPDVYGDQSNVKILTGTLQHNTAPYGLATIHIVFMRDEVTGTLGPITFETTAFGVASQFDRYTGKDVSIVVRVLTRLRRAPGWR